MTRTQTDRLRRGNNVMDAEGVVHVLANMSYVLCDAVVDTAKDSLTTDAATCPKCREYSGLPA